MEVITTKKKAILPKKSISEKLIGNTNFSTLLAAVQVAGLIDTFSGPGTYTVFAPTDKAFAKVDPAALQGLLDNPEDLKKVLLGHVVGEKIKARTIPLGKTDKTAASGDILTVDRSRTSITVGSNSVPATIVKFDIPASNGIIHVIDTVILPSTPLPPTTPTKSIAEIVIDNPNTFSTLLKAVKVAGLVDTLSGPGTFTVFAPTNDAFAKVDSLNGLLADPEALENVLLRHVVEDKIKEEDIPYGRTDLEAASGDILTVDKSRKAITVGSSSATAKVGTFDILASNGIIHVIDTVI